MATQSLLSVHASNISFNRNFVLTNLMTLKEKIIQKIKSEGPINFETFMEMALYSEGLGYYAKDSIKIGRAGDFYTSPHLHFIFGAMLGRQMEEMWAYIGKPDVFNVVEIGAGMGYLAKDMLEYLQKKKSEARSQTGSPESRRLSGAEMTEENLFQCLKYTIVELNPTVKEKQRELLSEFSDKIEWVSHLHDLKPVTGCFLSNELLDAFPVRVVETDNGLKEIYVSVDEDSFVELKMPCSNEIKEYFNEFNISLPEGYRTEVNLKIKDWLKEISNKISKGFILTIDYGYTVVDYYSEVRNRGTLLCYYKHQINEDIYQNIGQNMGQNIGEQDMTAHVNFSSLKKWGEEMGLTTVGFCPQGTYLVSLGIDEVIKELYGDSPDFFDIAKIKGLILPQGMGESHKVIVMYKGRDNMALRGFRLRNQIKYL